MPRRKKIKDKEPQRHHLSRIQTAQLYNWLKKRKREAKATDHAILASTASQELGFPISMPQMRDMKREMGLWSKRGEGASRTRRADKDTLRMLARELIEAREALSLPISAQLQQLAK